MPEHLRSLVVLLALATFVFMFAKAPACAAAMTPEDFARRRNLWFGITLTAFLAHNFWIYIMVAGILLIVGAGRESNKMALFYFLLFALPPISGEISGLGIIRYFFDIDYLRLLILMVLLPAFLSLQRQPGVERFGRSIPDKLIGGFLILNVVLMLDASTFTNTLRQGVFYKFVDIFLPYYVASRSLKDIRAFRGALTSFVLAALVLSAIGVFEFARHWLLYASLDDALGMKWSFGNYLERGGGDLRAQASTGHAIVLGYVVAVASGFLHFLRRSVINPVVWGLWAALLALGILATVSRGPWLGAALILLIFVATGPSPVKGLSKLALLGVIAGAALLASPVGEKIIASLSFLGGEADVTVEYRQRLLEISINVILQNPFFGAYDYIYSPAMQDLKQGQGIVDIVNSYLAVGLGSGLTGLLLFSGFFVAVAVSIFKGMKRVSDNNDELHLLGRVLLASLLGIMLIIFTVSSITVIPVIYWSVAGIGVAYARMVALARVSDSEPTLNKDTRTGSSKYSPSNLSPSSASLR